jgi:hypothetical protein
MADRPNTTIITEYVHGGPEARDEYVDLWPNEAPQQEVIHYMLCEEEVDVEVNLDTGRWRYIAFAGSELKDPKWFPGRTDD